MVMANMVESAVQSLGPGFAASPIRAPQNGSWLRRLVGKRLGRRRWCSSTCIGEGSSLGFPLKDRSRAARYCFCMHLRVARGQPSKRSPATTSKSMCHSERGGAACGCRDRVRGRLEAARAQTLGMHTLRKVGHSAVSKRANVCKIRSLQAFARTKKRADTRRKSREVDSKVASHATSATWYGRSQRIPVTGRLQHLLENRYSVNSPKGLSNSAGGGNIVGVMSRCWLSDAVGLGDTA